MEANPIKIEWESHNQYLFFNPQAAKEISQKFYSSVEKYSCASHLWIPTSGQQKLVALSFSAFLSSARSVNEHLGVVNSDIWGLLLPRFHVGGLSIEARAYLKNNLVKNYFQHADRWSAQKCAQWLKEEKITLTSMVPTQIYDLVDGQFYAPENLKAVIVGGSALSPRLYHQAKELGWPLLPSYGMTECASQVATADLSSVNNNEFPILKVMPHLAVQTNDQGSILIKGESLMTGAIHFYSGNTEWQPHEKGAWYFTQDRGVLTCGHLVVLGRNDDFIKILGEGVNLHDLNLRMLRWHSEIHIMAEPDGRKGFQLLAIASQTVKKDEIRKALDLFNRNCMPFERLSLVCYVSHLPKTELGKIKWNGVVPEGEREKV